MFIGFFRLLGINKMSELNAIEIKKRTGEESFHINGRPLDFNLLNFWQWSSSDLSNNALRGKLAEFLVAQALDASTGVRVEWDCYDLKLSNGISIEVKSASYLQSWSQKKHSSISFDMRPTCGWNAETNNYTKEAKRQADIYVFCLLTHQDKSSLDPTDMMQWEFFVLPSKILNEKLYCQKRVSLKSLLAIKPNKCNFYDLKDTVLNTSIA